jgi:hypothetical protein
VSELWERVLPRLPADVTHDAQVTGSGDPLWTAEMALRVVAWAGAHDHAILGGEVYHRIGPMQTSFLDDWEAAPDGAAEQRPAYVRRTAQQAMAAIERSARDGDPHRRYYLALGPKGT